MGRMKVAAKIVPARAGEAAMLLPPNLQADLEATGYFVLSALLAAHELGPLRDQADRILGESQERGGARNALGRSALFASLASEGGPARVARALLGRDSRPVKLTIFDKAISAN